MYATARHVLVLSHCDPAVTERVSTDPCGQPLVVDEGGHRLAEAMTRRVRHAKVLAHLTPAGTEVVRVPPRPGGRREDHRLLTEIRHATTSSQHSAAKAGSGRVLRPAAVFVSSIRISPWP